MVLEEHIIWLVISNPGLGIALLCVSFKTVSNYTHGILRCDSFLFGMFRSISPYRQAYIFHFQGIRLLKSFYSQFSSPVATDTILQSYIFCVVTLQIFINNHKTHSIW